MATSSGAQHVAVLTAAGTGRFVDASSSSATLPALYWRDDRNMEQFCDRIEDGMAWLLALQTSGFRAINDPADVLQSTAVRAR